MFHRVTGINQKGMSPGKVRGSADLGNDCFEWTKINFFVNTASKHAACYSLDKHLVTNIDFVSFMVNRHSSGDA